MKKSLKLTTISVITLLSILLFSIIGNINVYAAENIFGLDLSKATSNVTYKMRNLKSIVY